MGEGIICFRDFSFFWGGLLKLFCGGVLGHDFFPLEDFNVWIILIASPEYIGIAMYSNIMIVSVILGEVANGKIL